MLSFSNKQILILALVALGLNGAVSDSCAPQEKQPAESISFAATKDDTAGARIGGFIEIKVGSKLSYVPLKLEKVEQIGHLEDYKSATLRLIMDCATVEMDLRISTLGENYNGTATEVRVFYQDEVYTISKPVFKFSKSIQDGSPDQTMDWSPFEFQSSGWITKKSKAVNFKSISFILESENVAYNYHKGIMNNDGYQAGWY